MTDAAGPLAARGEDDLSRQRRKREARLRQRLVAGFPGMTAGEVPTGALAATEEPGAAFDVDQYEVLWGHSWQTAETLLAHPRLHGAHPCYGDFGSES